MTPPLAGERQGRCLDCRCGLYVHIGAQTRCEGVQKKKSLYGQTNQQIKVL